MQPGDVYCLNDPFEGGMHLPDVFVLQPIFRGGARVAFAATICHQTDVGEHGAAQHGVERELIAQGPRPRPHPLTDGRVMDHPADQLGGQLAHPAAPTGGADAAPFAAEGGVAHRLVAL